MATTIKFVGTEALSALASAVKSYVEGKISAIDTTLFSVVTSLPTSGIDENKIYLVPATTTADNNVYIEYVYANGSWEKVGEASATVDLSGYVNSVSATGTAPLTLSGSISGNKLTLTGSVSAATTSAAGTMSAADKAKLDGIDTDSLVSQDDLSEYAKTDDLSEYAKESELADYAKSEDIPEFEEITASEIDALFD